MKSLFNIAVSTCYYFLSIFFMVSNVLYYYFNTNIGIWHKNISFEGKAYANQTQLDYLNQRPSWGFLKYLCSHEF